MSKKEYSSPSSNVDERGVLIFSGNHSVFKKGNMVNSFKRCDVRKRNGDYERISQTSSEQCSRKVKNKNNRLVKKYWKSKKKPYWAKSK